MKKLTAFLFTFFCIISLHAEDEPVAQTITDETLVAAAAAKDVSQTPAPAPVDVPKTDPGPENEDLVDPRILRDFVESRGLIACRQKCGQLTIAGDARARYICTGEELKGIKQRGFGSPRQLPINVFKSEFNLFLDYVDKRSWVSTKVKWTVQDGLEGVSPTRTELDRAFIGYDIYECKEQDFYIELGRSRLDYIFDSRVEFSSFFDGIHLYYTNEIPRVGTFVIHGGPFVVDSYTNHYAWVFETYIDDWADTGWIFKYSLIDWRRRHATRYNGEIKPPPINDLILDNPRYRFLVSQMLFGYTSEVNFCRCKTLYLYGAVLANHDARKTETLNNKLENKAWYVGFTLGKLCKACDWSLDANYQYVQAQAVPEFDLAGIGHGNAGKFLFSDAIFQNLRYGEALGFTNFKGIQVSLLYALTDALSLRTKGEWTQPINKDLGGNFNYKNFEFAVIYAF